MLTDCTKTNGTQSQPGIERMQALADISRSALCCHSNKTRGPIANPPNSAQLEGTPTIPPTYTRVRAVVWDCGEGQTDKHRHTNTQTAVTNIHFASATPHAKCNQINYPYLNVYHSLWGTPTSVAPMLKPDCFVSSAQCKYF